MDRATAALVAAAVRAFGQRRLPRRPRPSGRRRAAEGRPTRGRATLLPGLAAAGCLVWAAPLPGSQTAPRPDRIAANLERQNGAAIYDLARLYPNLAREQRGYFLVGTNRYLVPASPSASDRTSLWFLPQADGAFKQFATSPYRECHWDLLRWTGGNDGQLVYLATDSGCYSVHSEVAFRPGIAFMPRLWTVGSGWSRRGESDTVYSEAGVPLCQGTNDWDSRVLGLTSVPGQGSAVHTQTDETQSLAPIAGAPPSSECPPGVTTSFHWQENFYLGHSIAVRSPGGARIGLDGGLMRSAGGNTAATGAAGHPQWDSRFIDWEPLPAAEAGRVTTATLAVADGSAGNTIALTYAAPVGGLREGVLTVAVPPGWTPPTTGNAAGCTLATAGVVATAGQTITVSGLTLPPHGQAVVTYGATSGGRCQAGDGAVASATPGAPVWQARVASRSETVFTSLTVSPSIDVDAPDGSGSLTSTTTSVPAGSAGATVTFAYAASEGGVRDGTVTIAVPPGWTAPGTIDAPGCTVATAGTVSTNGQTITITDLTLAANASDVVTYGATSGASCGPGDGVAVPDTTGASSFAVAEMSTPGGSLVPLAASPVLTVA